MGKALQEKAKNHLEKLSEADMPTLKTYDDTLVDFVELGTSYSMLFSHQMGYLRPNINPEYDRAKLQGTY